MSCKSVRICLCAIILLSICRDDGLSRDGKHSHIVFDRIDAGLDPRVDARAAIARGNFGLMVELSEWDDETRDPFGVICFTPSGAPTSVSYSFAGFAGEHHPGLAAYAAEYNRTIVDHPMYPDADICAPHADIEPYPGYYMRDTRFKWPARILMRKPVTIYEAARRGTIAQIKQFGTDKLNTPDGVGMTPLAWAVAHHNRPAIKYLIKVGAKPSAGDGPITQQYRERNPASR